jgi:beta-N-acetylhexosaminidase
VPPRAVVLGIAGPELTEAEAALLRSGRPAGAILFGRNVVDPAQLRRLTADLRAVLPEQAVLMVDQEGGRVARLRPPHWRRHPPAAAIGEVYARDAEAGLRAAWLTGALIGLDCAAAGFDVVCAPVLDLRVPGAHDVIGDRAYASDPFAVARLGRAMAEGLLAAGVQPVAKHAPGHGRTRLDTHLALPVVNDATDEDLAPFIRNADLPCLMTSHIVFPAWDPDLPATLSPTVIAEVIRGRIGFGGLLISDDLAMGALSGAPETRVSRSLAAGCDLALFCPGDAAANEAVLKTCPPLSEAAVARMHAARTLASRRQCALDAFALETERSGLLS